MKQGLILLLVAVLAVLVWLLRPYPAKVLNPTTVAISAVGLQTPAIPASEVEGQSSTPLSSQLIPKVSDSVGAQPPPPPSAAKDTVPMHGRLSDPKGGPIPFGKVEGFAWDIAAKKLTRLMVETDDLGNFIIECPRATFVTFTAHLPGFRRAFNNGQASESRDVVLSLRESIDFEAALTRSDGSAVPNARLKFHPFGIHASDLNGRPIDLNLLNGTIPVIPEWDAVCRSSMFMTDCTVRTDDKGRFRADSVMSSTTYLLEVESDGLPAGVVEVYTRTQKNGNIIRLPF